MAIKINLGTLGEGSQVFEFVVGPKELDLDTALIKDKLNISADILKVSRQVDMKVTVIGKYKLVCDRCLETFELPFEKDFELVFVQKSGREGNFDNDYVKIYNPFMRSIDITEDVREFVLLGIPMKKLPGEKLDGTCSWCGRSKDYWKNYLKFEEHK
jgi:uncharacterized metal-binding protein YceD (DUF177 family)